MIDAVLQGGPGNWSTSTTAYQLLQEDSNEL
jgi:hypothetical protein